MVHATFKKPYMVVTNKKTTKKEVRFTFFVRLP